MMGCGLEYCGIEMQVWPAAGGIQMTVCLIIISIVLAHTGVGQAGVPDQPWVAWFTLVFICIYIAAYAWSCKPALLTTHQVWHGFMCSMASSVACSTRKLCNFLRALITEEEPA